MSSELEKWAVIERQFLKQDIEWLNAGAKLLSPSGDDVSKKKLEELEARLEHVQKVLMN